jgi:hypothetical protein
MGEVDRDRHWPWLGFALDEGIRLGVTDAQELITFATPEVLVAQLPHDVMSLLISRALSSGSISPGALLETASPALLAEHLESEVLWRCLSEAANRHQLTQKGGRATDEGKRWVASILQKALDSQLVTPAEVVKFVPPAEFVRNAPLAVVAEMIRAGLTKGNFDPALVLVHLTPKVIAEHLEVALAWGCLVEAVRKHFELGDVVAAAEAPPTSTTTTTTVAPTLAAPAVTPTPPVAEKPAAKPAEAAPAARAAAPARKDASVVTSAKIDPVAVRRAPPVAPKGDHVSAAGNGNGNGNGGWNASDDLELIDDQPLPPPPALQKR